MSELRTSLMSSVWFTFPGKNVFLLFLKRREEKKAEEEEEEEKQGEVEEDN